MTTKQAREAVRALVPTAVGAGITACRRTRFYVLDPDDRSTSAIGQGDTQHRAWLDALARLRRPRIYPGPAGTGMAD